jgi:pyruvate carboxylase
VVEQAETLSFPNSVIDFLSGHLGEPYGGYPEPLRTRVLHGHPPINGRPGASLPSLDLGKIESVLRETWGPRIRDVDVLSAALYPKVFDEYMGFRNEYSDVSVLPTRAFIAPLRLNEEIAVEIERGKTLIVKLTAVGELDASGEREVFFELNGQPRSIQVADASVDADQVTRERADAADSGSVGAPMPGVVVEVRAQAGSEVAAGDPLVVLSAMKMETVVASPVSGKVVRVAVVPGDSLAAGDLLAVVEPAVASTG